MKFNFILAIAMILCAFCILPVDASGFVRSPDLLNWWVYDVSYTDTSANDLNNIFAPDMDVYQQTNYIAFGWMFEYDPSLNLPSAYRYTPYATDKPFQPGVWQLGLDDYGGGFAIISCPWVNGQYDMPYKYDNRGGVLHFNYDESMLHFQKGENYDYNISLLTSSGDYNTWKVTLQFTGQSITISKFYQGFPEYIDNYNVLFENDLEDSVIYEYFFTIPTYVSEDIYYFASDGGGLYNQLMGFTLPATTESPISEEIPFTISAKDFQTGNLLSGYNLTVYSLDNENNVLGNIIYQNSNSPATVTINATTHIFIEANMNGYELINAQNYDYLNNRFGKAIAVSQNNNESNLLFQAINPNISLSVRWLIKDENNQPIDHVTVIMDNSKTLYSNSIGSVEFLNISQGMHTFVFSKAGFNTVQTTKNIMIQYAYLEQIMTKETTLQPTLQPTLTPIDKPSNIMESVSFGFAKIFGVKTVENANYIFALMLILFPAVIAGGITHQALGFIAGGLIGFIFALAVGLIPIWVFFAMCLLSVIFMILKGGNEGF